ncbi:hypothetical protein FOA52_003602 [Chlamydomonas sp. UWO 241]|nr:hypothetical protein FOA52_003602 [Chlamydomonas sp. UWO 241]
MLAGPRPRAASRPQKHARGPVGGTSASRARGNPRLAGPPLPPRITATPALLSSHGASAVARELSLFDPSLSCAESATAPSSWYTLPEFHALDTDAVLKQSWLHVGHTGDVARPGQFFTGSIAGQPYVVVRGAEDGVLRAFYNVCSHHAMRVASGTGSCTKLECPYHGWAYRHDGSLCKTTHLAGIKDFRHQEHGLKPITVDTYASLVFIHLGGDGGGGAPGLSLAQALDPIAQQAEGAGGLDSLTFLRRVVYHLNCNWKVFVDNYCDGGYHLPYAHPALASGVDMATYHCELFRRVSVQTVSAGGGAGVAAASECSNGAPAVAAPQAVSTDGGGRSSGAEGGGGGGAAAASGVSNGAPPAAAATAPLIKAVPAGGGGKGSSAEVGGGADASAASGGSNDTPPAATATQTVSAWGGAGGSSDAEGGGCGGTAAASGGNNAPPATASSFQTESTGGDGRGSSIEGGGGAGAPAASGGSNGAPPAGATTVPSSSPRSASGASIGSSGLPHATPSSNRSAGASSGATTTTPSSAPAGGTSSGSSASGSPHATPSSNGRASASIGATITPPTSDTSSGSSVSVSAERLGSGAVYAFAYPNFMLNRYGPWCDTNTVVPTGPRSCTVTFDYFLEESSGLASDAAYIDSALAASHAVQLEDEALCHAVQEGLESDAYIAGRYVPKFEAPMHHFHQLLHADYSSALAKATKAASASASRAATGAGKYVAAPGCVVQPGRTRFRGDQVY